jgi:transcription initiation factor TFIIE subunit alpha
MIQNRFTDNVVLVDDAGWGDLIMGVVVGAFRPSDQEYLEHRIPTSSFQPPEFENEKYVREAVKIAEEIVDAMQPEKETIFKIGSGKVLSRIRTYLKGRGYKIEDIEETGKLQEKVEKSYVKWCVNAGVPLKELDPNGRFWRLLNWVNEKPSSRGKFVKTGWGTWQLGFVNHDTLTKVARVIGGEEGAKIIEVLSHVYETQDTEIVAKTGISLNTVRKILYKLYDHSLVSLRRHRDKDTGWFIFHWRLQPEQVNGFLTNQKMSILEKLVIRLKYEKNHEFYYCQTPECRRLTFEEAAENIFRCPKCDKLLTYNDNNNIITFLTEKIKQLKNELNESS